jgi:uncharacterized protein (TIGR00369 family)
MIHVHVAERREPLTRRKARKVVAAQNITRMCLVCGAENGAGLQARFYELESGESSDGEPAVTELIGVFTPRSEHQGYPGRLHGGILSAIVDETIGRAIAAMHPGMWMVTVELTVRYRKPVQLDGEVKAIARKTSSSGRLFEGTGEIVLRDGTVAVEASGLYVEARHIFESMAPIPGAGGTGGT